MFETVNYTYRLRPGAQAQGALLTEWHRCRFLWNEAVHQNRIGNKPTLCKLSKLLTEARGRSTWLRSGSQVAQQQTLLSLIHISEPTRLGMISYAVFCLK